MSYNIIKEGLEKVNNINSWSLALINYNHKSRPCEYTCYQLNFQSDQLLKNTLNEMCSSFMSIIDKKNKIIQEYTGMNPKNVVDKLSITNELIMNSWNSLIQSLCVCNDDIKLENTKSKAFIFAGTYEIEGIEHNLYLLSRKNPIYTYKKNKSKIFESRHNRIQEINEPLVQFGKTFDILIYKDTLYTINTNFESIFNFEYTHKIACKNSLLAIEKADIINDFKAFKTFAFSGQNPKKFITYDQQIIENIKDKNNLKILVDELKIPYDTDHQKFNLCNKNHAELFTKAICGKTKYNMFTGGVCEVPTSTPLNLS